MGITWPSTPFSNNSTLPDSMSKVLILCATEFEMAGFLDLHPDLHKHRTRSGLVLYSSPLAFDCLISGPGVLNTSHALTLYLEQTRPDLILHTGIAGVFAGSGLGIGDMALATQEHYLHTGVGTGTLQQDPLPFDLIQNQPLTRQGIYAFDPLLVKFYQGIFTQALGDDIALGKFITVSSITASRDQAQKIFSAWSPVMEAMEGAAAAHVAALYQVPLIEIRAGSNWVGERNKETWNFPLACNRVAWICQKIIQQKLP